MSIEHAFLANTNRNFSKIIDRFHSPMLQGMLNIKRVGQVEVDHNDRPVDDVMIKKGSILMQ